MQLDWILGVEFDASFDWQYGVNTPLAAVEGWSVVAATAQKDHHVDLRGPNTLGDASAGEL
jgi:hypothetical protein